MSCDASTNQRHQRLSIFQPKENEVWLDSNYDEVVSCLPIDGIAPNSGSAQVELVEAPLTGPGDVFWKIDKAMQS